MYLGIDVGGTHTDGVCLGDDFAIARVAKVPTRADCVMESLSEVLGEILTGIDPAKVRRLALSSTVGLNAVLTGRADPVGVLATGGPGLAPDWAEGGPLFALLGAALDHRGEILRAFSAEEAEGGIRRLLASGAKAFALISKFGPKNSAFEEAMAGAAQKLAPGFPITRASELAGRLNFPRRLHTAVFNSAVTRLYAEFLRDVEAAAGRARLGCPIMLLSSEGGAMTVAEAQKSPVKILAAGPAAGILGLWAMADLSGDALMIDIGGTSTDLAVMADGRPLMTAEGLAICGRPTLVRAFLSSSIALGGDSALTFDNGECRVGPNREGPALALCPNDAGTRRPTLTDALNVLGLADVGDRRVSLKAFGRNPETQAQAALDCALEMVETAARKLLEYVNSRPVYTIDEVRLARELSPARAALLGGPAEALAAPLEKRLNIPTAVPKESSVANAVGAALARPAVSAELYADTALGRMNVPALGISRAIDKSYNAQKAETELLELLAQKQPSSSPVGKPVITQSQSFHQLVTYGRSDKIIRVQGQIAPGVLSCKN